MPVLRRPRPFAAACVASAVLAALSACVDLKPAPAPVVRWLTLAAREGEPAYSEPTEPRILRPVVEAADSIDERLIRRVSEVELRYDDLVRWAEPPARLLERALDHSLFQEGPFERVTSAGRSLVVTLIEFEERTKPRRAAAVALNVRATDIDGALLVDRRFESVVPTDGEDPAVLAVAMSRAVTLAIDQVAELLTIR